MTEYMKENVFLKTKKKNKSWKNSANVNELLVWSSFLSSRYKHNCSIFFHEKPLQSNQIG